MTPTAPLVRLLALQRLGDRLGIHPWTEQPEPTHYVPNRADRRRNRRTKGAAQ